MRQWLSLILMIVLLAANGGCAGLHSHPTAAPEVPSQECAEYLARLDETTVKAGVRDASSFPVPGFPNLRTNRFLEALGERALTPGQQAQWLHLMEQLDLQARSREIANLPAAALASVSPGLASPPTRNELLAHVQSCSSALLGQDENRAAVLAALRSAARVPDEYSALARALGFFPISSIPVVLIGEHANVRMKSWYAGGLENRPIQGKLEFFGPRDQPQLSADAISKLLLASRQNPLRLPSLSEEQEHALAQSLAPIFWQDVAASYDVPGRIVHDSGRPELDPKQPTVYYYVSHAIVLDQAILQMNYVIWYAARAGKTPPWLEKGRLDGLTVRISLDTEGKPFMLDAMNNCGCYHFYVPRSGVVQGIRPTQASFSPLVPQWLPLMAAGQRLGVRVNSGWHQVERVLALGGSTRATPYELLPYASLESFRDTEGSTVSLFDARGIVRGSERPERFVLFAMGIPSIGSMRQRGHHAIDFTNPEHFDDPYLFDKHFIIEWIH